MMCQSTNQSSCQNKGQNIVSTHTNRLSGWRSLEVMYFLKAGCGVKILELKTTKLGVKGLERFSMEQLLLWLLNV